MSKKLFVVCAYIFLIHYSFFCFSNNHDEVLNWGAMRTQALHDVGPRLGQNPVALPVHHVGAQQMDVASNPAQESCTDYVCLPAACCYAAGCYYYPCFMTGCTVTACCACGCYAAPSYVFVALIYCDAFCQKISNKN